MSVSANGRPTVIDNVEARRKAPLWKRLRRHFRLYWQLWALVMPAICFTVVFAYIPMYGVQLAFRRYDITKGLTGGKWVGFQYFRQFFNDPLFGEIIANTFRISLWTLTMGFIAPILLALLINQIGGAKIKGFVQTITYMPHFISTVVMVSMIQIFLQPGNGLLGRFLSGGYVKESLCTLTAVGIAVLVYLILVIALRMITREDLKMVPHGEKLARLLHL